MTEEHIENKILWSSNNSIPLDSNLLNELANNYEITPEINEVKPELTLDELLIKIASLPKHDITIDTPSLGLLDETSLQSPHKSPHTNSISNTIKVAKYETQMPITTGIFFIPLLSCIQLIFVIINLFVDVRDEIKRFNDSTKLSSYSSSSLPLIGSSFGLVPTPSTSSAATATFSSTPSEPLPCSPLCAWYLTDGIPNFCKHQPVTAKRDYTAILLVSNKPLKCYTIYSISHIS